MATLSGKGAVVYGAGGKDNMGQAIARRLIAEGAEVMVTGRKQDVLEEFVAQHGGACHLVDITSRTQVFDAAREARKCFGNLSIGVNATGWGLLKPFEENTEEDLDKMLATQFKGPFFFLQAMIEGMTEGGSIVQISSATATIQLEQHAAYMGTKAGIDHVVRTVANEFGHRGIRANSVSPGLTETPMAGDAFSIPAFIEAFRKEYPLGRVGTVEDIAAAVAWLANDECFMTGQNLQVNGGLTLRRNPSLAELAELAEKATQHLRE